MAFHILRNKHNQFYWVSIIKKGNSFEHNGRSSESYVSKQGCKKSIRNEVYLAHGVEADIMDHSADGPEMIFLESAIGSKSVRMSRPIKMTEENFNISLREYRYVRDYKPSKTKAK